MPFDDKGSEPEEQEEVRDLEPDEPRLKDVGFAEVGEAEGEEGQRVCDFDLTVAISQEPTQYQGGNREPCRALEEVEGVVGNLDPGVAYGVVSPPCVKDQVVCERSKIHESSNDDLMFVQDIKANAR